MDQVVGQTGMLRVLPEQRLENGGGALGTDAAGCQRDGLDGEFELCFKAMKEIAQL